MAKYSLAHNAPSNPEDESGDLEHVGEITPRAMLPVTKLRTCAACGGRFGGQDVYEVQDEHLTFFEGDPLCQDCALHHGVL